MQELKFLRCELCGNIITFLNESGVTPECCGTSMTELTANTEDAATEKHVPEVTVDGDKVTAVIGSVAHPMEEKHYIQWIVLETDKGVYTRFLEPNQKPEAVFKIHNEKPVSVYEYCNLHGLWKTDL
jgi:superoxide reductase